MLEEAWKNGTIRNIPFFRDSPVTQPAPHPGTPPPDTTGNAPGLSTLPRGHHTLRILHLRFVYNGVILL